MTTILLELTVDDARFVRDVMRFVGGPAATTRRKHAERIEDALTGVLGQAPMHIPDAKGAVYMTEAPRTLSIFERDALKKLEGDDDLEDLCDCTECHGGCDCCEDAR